MGGTGAWSSRCWSGRWAEKRRMSSGGTVMLVQPTMEHFVRLAHAHRGYFTAAEAIAAGISRRSLTHHSSSGTLHRLAYGIYRLNLYHDPYPVEDVMVAALWAGSASAISHQSALALHGLGEMPPLVHLTTPEPFRGRRSGVVIHCQRLADHDVVVLDTVPVTSVERTLVDVAAIDPAAGRTAARAALARAVTTIERLESALMGSANDSARAALLDAAVLGPPTAPAVSAVQVRARPSGPTVDSAFIGREDELDGLASLLSASRLLTITGPPGVGKSRLATELAARVADRYPDGVSVVQLASVSDPSLVAGAVAEALTVWEQAGRSITDALAEYLEPLRCLVILDNCEHLVAGCAPLVERLIASCPEVSIVATSQVPLNIAVEQAWSVPPLPIPAAEADAEDVAASEAVQLFCDRAAATRRGFRLDDQNLGAVVEICRRLDGLPLAIELAAARAAVLTPAGIVSRLDDAFALLAEGATAGLPRHKTLRATLDWSHQLLPADEQVLLRRLSVFMGGCTLEAVEGICGDDGSGPPSSLLDSLASLVSKSMVVADTGGRDARYRMLQTIRLYGAERLAEAGEAEVFAARHGRWYAALAEEAEPALTGPGQVSWLDRLDADHDNLRAALKWAADGGHGEEALRLAGSLALFWRVRGYFAEGRRWLETALAISSAQAGSEAHGLALWGAALLSNMVGDRPAAVRFGQQSLELARQRQDLRAEARSLLVLANAGMWTDAERTVPMLQEAVDTARRADDPWCLAHALGLIGRVREHAGDSAQARTVLEECVAVAEAAKDQQSLRLGLLVLGDLALHRGAMSEAAGLLEQALGAARVLAEPYAVSVALGSLAELLAEQGELDRAADLQREALGLARQAGSADGQAGALFALGELGSQLGHTSGARYCYQQAMETLSKAGYSIHAPLQGLGQVALVEGDLATARAMLTEALALARATGDKRAIAGALSALGALEVTEGRHQEAVQCYLEALELRHKVGAAARVADSLETVAGAAGSIGDLDYAARLLGAAEALRQRNGYARKPGPQKYYDAHVAVITAGLGAQDFEAAWVEGARMSMAGAVAYARRGRTNRRGASEGWPSLTSTQRQVAELVTEGLTNAQIAERLFVSPRTVAAHVGKIFAKLHISSRSQVASQRPPER